MKEAVFRPSILSSLSMRKDGHGKAHASRPRSSATSPINQLCRSHGCARQSTLNNATRKTLFDLPLALSSTSPPSPLPLPRCPAKRPERVRQIVAEREEGARRVAAVKEESAARAEQIGRGGRCYYVVPGGYCCDVLRVGKGRGLPGISYFPNAVQWTVE